MFTRMLVNKMFVNYQCVDNILFKVWVVDIRDWYSSLPENHWGILHYTPSNQNPFSSVQKKMSFNTRKELLKQGYLAKLQHHFEDKNWICSFIWVSLLLMLLLLLLFLLVSLLRLLLFSLKTHASVYSFNTQNTNDEMHCGKTFIFTGLWRWLGGK